MTVEALAADCADVRDLVNHVQSMSAAKRMRRYRQRRRDGLRCLTIQLRETEIEALIYKGLLNFETRASWSGKRIYQQLCDG
jgi:hypothetical protein